MVQTFGLGGWADYGRSRTRHFSEDPGASRSDPWNFEAESHRVTGQRRAQHVGIVGECRQRTTERTIRLGQFDEWRAAKDEADITIRSARRGIEERRTRLVSGVFSFAALRAAADTSHRPLSRHLRRR